MTPEGPQNRSSIATSLGIIACVVVVAALRSAAPLVVPVLLATFAAMIAAPPMLWLKRHGFPTAVAIAVIVLGMLLILFVLGVVVGSSVNDLDTRLPDYRAKLTERLKNAEATIQGYGIPTPDDMLNVFDPGRLMHLAVEVLNAISGTLTNVALILFITILILFEVTDLPVKLQVAFPGADGYGRLAEIAEVVKRYLAIKTVISAVTGIMVWIFVRSMGVDYAIVWALLAFALNFIPSIGSILAAVPAVLMAFVQFGAGKALIVAAGYVLINVVMGNFIEPRITGQSVGLSTLVVFLSLLFWGWVFGPVGMLLSVPLTMVIKIALDRNPRSRWIAVLLGSAAPDESPAA